MQEAINWEELRRKKTEEYGTKYKNLVRHLVWLYKDRTHFLYELLQNAADAGASRVTFLLEQEQFVVEHNGTLFSKKDVVSITDVESGKSGTEFIGKFGIGFKSVYAYTTRPRIYSGRYAFEIRDFLLPYEIRPISLEANQTRIEIPFNRPCDDADMDREAKGAELKEVRDTAFAEISRAFQRQIDGTAILFLRRMESLEIRIQGSPSTIVWIREPKDQGGVKETIICQETIRQGVLFSKQESAYWVFADEREETAAALLHKGNEVVPVSNPRVFAFFPTDRESHQSFLLQAPFEPTPARDNIREDSRKNQELIETLCGLIRRAFLWLRDRGWLTVSILNGIYPMYRYEEDTIFRRIYDSAVQTLADGEALLPTNKQGVYKPVSSVLLPESESLGNLVDDSDLQELLGSFRVFWLSRHIALDKNRAFRTFLMEQYNPRVVSWTELLEKLTPQFLENKKLSWFERFFPAVSGIVTLRPANLHEADGRKLPLIRLEDGRHIRPWERGKPSVYLNNPENCPNQIDSEFLSSPIVRDFYARNLGIQEYSPERIVLDEILPRYRTEADAQSVSWEAHLEDMKTIRDALRTAPYMAGSLRNSFLLTDGKSWRHPQELHIPDDFTGKSIPEYRLLDGVSQIRFLSPGYERVPILDLAFFRRLGCPDTLAMEQIPRETYLKLVQTYEENGSKRVEELKIRFFGKHGADEAAWKQCSLVFEGFLKILNHPDLHRSKEIARFLNRNLQSFTLRTTLNFRGTEKEVWTAMGLLLTGKAWLFRKDGKCLPVRELRRSDLEPSYERLCKNLLNILPFQEEDQALEAVLSRIDSQQDRETLKRLLEHPEELEQITKAQLKRQEDQQKREERRNRSDRERFEDALKKRGRAEAPRAEPEYDPAPNPERRQKKIEEEFRETMDHFVAVPRTSLQYTYRETVSPEEKATLAEWYQGGYCQICRTAIVKWDGRLHFQAVNFLDTSRFQEAERATLGLCWNSLCLCPNCAAKYRYGPKDISAFVDQADAQTVEAGSDEAIPIRIVLQDREEIIHYAPRHFIALKAALNVYRKRDK